MNSLQKNKQIVVEQRVIHKSSDFYVLIIMLDMSASECERT